MKKVYTTMHQKRLLRQFVRGECPRISSAVFEDLCRLDGMPNALQRESADGADTSGGFILTNLHGLGDSIDDVALVREWMADNGIVSR